MEKARPKPRTSASSRTKQATRNKQQAEGGGRDENTQQAAFALDDYKKGMRQMKSNLINPQPKSMTDDRIYF